jgi:glycine/D-amino acid oxidase-like deaminating enzyme
LQLRKDHPSARILILEKGKLPEGASTKNAGFACFGSPSELLDDLRMNREEAVVDLVHKRWKGLQTLRQQLGDAAIKYAPHGGYEVFLNEDKATFDQCKSQLPYLNDLLRPIFKSDVFSVEIDRFAFGNSHEYLIFNQFEGQLDTGAMMLALLQKANEASIRILNGIEVLQYTALADGVEVATNGFSVKTKQLFFATNGFAAALTDHEVRPGRAQVLITEPIEDLDIKGTFHLDKGYYYFRNIDNRILLGGGRNLDFEGETTTNLGVTALIQNKLETLLREVILPGKNVAIAQRWSGIMGLGNQKNPIVKSLETRVHCGVRLGGMGVALGTLVGQELAALAQE